MIGLWPSPNGDTAALLTHAGRLLAEKSACAARTQGRKPYADGEAADLAISAIPLCTRATDRKIATV